MKYLVMGIIFFGSISIVIQICKYVYDYRSDWMDLFNLDRELNFPTWYSTLMLAFCAFLLRIIAIGKKQERDRYAADWKLLSFIFFLLAIDEILSIHEILIIPEVSKALNLPWFLHSMWVIPGTIFVFWFAKRYWKFSRHLPQISQRHFITAGGIYIGGALIMEMVGSYLAEAQGQQHLPYALAATVEEILEMIGTVIFIYGLLYYLSKWQEKISLHLNILEDI
ncbi:hypothetical protein NIES4102_19430 [Chondrocystis sp. NIES-4102]|nr:hypothetical protein NIES4102_19430 [Chondrocystis sp. NIES-4102]